MVSFPLICIGCYTSILDLQDPHNINQNYPNSSQNSPTVVNQWLINQPSQKPENNQPKIDINAITNQVERNLKRKFIVESERRGYKKWR